MAPTIGKLDPFDETVEDWEAYVERVQEFFKANDVGQDKQVSTLISTIGAKTYGLLRSLTAPDKPSTKTFAQITNLLKNHLAPEPIVIAERFRFYKREQKEGESLAEYIATLKKLTAHCKFGNFLQEALRDKLVCGLNNKMIQERLLCEADLSWDSACKIAKAQEAAIKDAAQLQGGAQKVHAVKEEHSTRCFRCGRRHKPDVCWYKDETCDSCGRKGHLSRQCKNKESKKESRSDKRRPDKGSHRRRRRHSQKKRSHKKVHNVEKSSDSESHTDYESSEYSEVETYAISIKSIGKGNDAILIPIEIAGKEIEMELDTGSAVTIMTSKDFEKVSKGKWQVKPTKVLLKTYTGERIKPLGEVDVDVRYDDKLYKKMTLYVVENTANSPALLGRDWLKHIQLNWKTINLLRAPVKIRKLSEVLKKHEELFKDELGTMKNYKASFQLKENVKPKFFKERPVVHAMKERVNKELKSLVKRGILTPVSHSEWATPIVPVAKDDGSVRICGDFKITINSAVEVDQYPIPRIEDLLANLNNGKSFTKIDLANAYLQMEVEEESKKLLVISTPQGLMKYNRLPFGVNANPAKFQNAMEKILTGCPGTQVYFDDILVTGKDDEEHLENLDRVLQKLSDSGLRLKKSKCEFMKPKIAYLGHVIDADGVHTDEKKVKAIDEAPAPTNVSELRSFLGMITYYSKFLPNMSSTLHPLNRLLRSDVKWKWSETCQASFEKIKHHLKSADVLVHYQPELPLVLATDASPYGVGAVISHIMPDGRERPIAFASRTLAKAEKKYSQLDKEALGIVFGVKRFHQYLWGRKWQLLTDHKPLTSILHPRKGVSPMTDAKLQRWAVLLAGYDYSISYRRSEDNSNADCMSRLPLHVAHENTHNPVYNFTAKYLQQLPVTSDQIKKATSRDPILSKVLQQVVNGWKPCDDPELTPYYTRRNELSTWDECVMWGMRVVVPSKLQDQVLDELHEGHLGVVKMKGVARSYIWWPNMDKKIEELASKCASCEGVKKVPSKAPIHPWMYPTKCWQRVHIDFAGPFQDKMFLVAVDAYSKWPEVKIMKTTTSSATIEQLEEIFSRNGIPDQVHTDNGPQFTSEEFTEFMKRNGILHTKSAPFHPASNGLAERFVQSLKQGLKAEKAKISIKSKLHQFLLAYRNAPHSTTGVSPAMCFMKRRLKNKLDLLSPNIHHHINKRQDQMSLQGSHSPARVYEVGDAVMARNYSRGEKWLRGVIISKDHLNYTISMDSGQVWRRHIDQIRKTQLEFVEPPQPVGPIKLPHAIAPEMQVPNMHPHSSPATPAQPMVAQSPATPQTPVPVVSTAGTQKRYPTRTRNPPAYLKDFVK